MGVQGAKRKLSCQKDWVASVDPIAPLANFRTLQEVPLRDYDAAICCIPDEPKSDLIKFLVQNSKHVLVEKPFWVKSREEFSEIEEIAVANNVLIKTAYNHRFEPHFKSMYNLISSGKLGKIYHCRLFYGNGTSALVRNSEWRDTGSGVLHDLGSHLLDTCNFWFGDKGFVFKGCETNTFENIAPDHASVSLSVNEINIELEMSLICWKNHFSCDLYAEKGSAHISSLCKWGPSKFTVRRRKFPSGVPSEDNRELIQSDPTWDSEYLDFKNSINEGQKTDLSKDRWLYETLNNLSVLSVSTNGN